MSSSDTTRCANCQQSATVRVRGVSLCAACALTATARRDDAPASRDTGRLASRIRKLGAISGVLMAKILFGAVALAAVGSVAVASVAAGSPRAGDSTTATTSTSQAPDEYRQAVQDWANCVALAAGAADSNFDPIAACGEWPTREAPVAADDSTSADDASSEAPGQTGTAPGLAETTPGQSETTPADGAEPPGLVGATPGQSEITPGQSGQNPGRSGEAPGHNKDND